MSRIKSCCIFFSVACCVFSPCCAQQGTCYAAGGVAGIVIATIVVTIVVMGLGLAAGWRLWSRKRDSTRQSQSNHKPSTDGRAQGDFAFDNPYFRDPEEEDSSSSLQHGKQRASINNKNPLRSSKQSDLSTKGKKTRSSRGHHFIFGGHQNKKQRALDDTCIAAEPERTVVSLKGHDFTGLGFNICGNMRDGILVKDVLHRGPASESGKIKAGDKIINVTVSFTNIVYEDALTILSYASPYDVQLELERTPEKSRDMQTSPSQSKRLGSGSFSAGGQKLFHPLYRSQSIDDLTQIDKDTFPSPGFGPRRSQSVGVAAHKLAAHFKNSDTRLEEKSSASVMISTTGSLNEKMLANVISEGALHKSGLQWEKRFEDTLENDITDSKSTAETVNRNNEQNPPGSSDKLSKGSVSSMDEDKSDISSGISNSNNRKSRDIVGHTNSSKQQKEPVYSSSHNENSTTDREISEVRTTAQVHHTNDSKSSNRKTHGLTEASNAMWHLDQSIRDVDSDRDSSNSYRSWKNNNHDSNPSTKYASSRTEEAGDNDSVVSGDSLEGETKKRRKKTKRRSSSLGDLNDLEEAVKKNSSTQDAGVGSSTDTSKEKLQSPSNTTVSQQRIIRRGPNAGEVNDMRERRAMTESPTVPVPPRGAVPDRNPGVTGEPQGLNRTQNTLSNYQNPSVSQMSNREKRLERVVMNSVHSPKLSVKSPPGSSSSRAESYQVHHESVYQSPDHYQPTPYVSPQHVIIEDAVQNHNRSAASYYAGRHDVGSPRNVSPHYPNMNQSIAEPDDSRTRFSPSLYQQAHCVNYQNQPPPRQRTIPEEEVRRNGPPPYHQAIRKAVNPAGMFTQINPFQQPSRQRNNVATKPWMMKDDSKVSGGSPMPVNGNDASYYPSSYPKPMVQVTTTDSAGRARVRNHQDPQSYQHQKHTDGGYSKTVLISTYDNANCVPGNYRQLRK